MAKINNVLGYNDNSRFEFIFHDIIMNLCRHFTNRFVFYKKLKKLLFERSQWASATPLLWSWHRFSELGQWVLSHDERLLSRGMGHWPLRWRTSALITITTLLLFHAVFVCPVTPQTHSLHRGSYGWLIRWSGGCGQQSTRLESERDIPDGESQKWELAATVIAPGPGSEGNNRAYSEGGGVIGGGGEDWYFEKQLG